MSRNGSGRRRRTEPASRSAWPRQVDTPLDGTAPCLLWGYGAYESCEWPPSTWQLVSLLDAGRLCPGPRPRWRRVRPALVGRWPPASKHNTFTDFVAAADALADRVVGRVSDRVAWALGRRPAARRGDGTGSAPVGRRRGRGALRRLRQLDAGPSVPLTVIEWDEWGDPRRPEDFRWMLAYSPYDNPPSGYRPPLLRDRQRQRPARPGPRAGEVGRRLRATAGPEATAPLLFRVRARRRCACSDRPVATVTCATKRRSSRSSWRWSVQTRCRDRADAPLLAGQRTHRPRMGPHLLALLAGGIGLTSLARVADLPASVDVLASFVCLFGCGGRGQCAPDLPAAGRAMRSGSSLHRPGCWTFLVLSIVIFSVGTAIYPHGVRVLNVVTPQAVWPVCTLSGRSRAPGGRCRCWLLKDVALVGVLVSKAMVTPSDWPLFGS